MSISEQLKSNLLAVPPFSLGDHDLRVAHTNQSVSCRLVASDSIGCMVESVVLEDNDLAGADIAVLRELSEQLCRRVTYLLEPISPIEADAESCTVQLRSVNPTVENQQKSYYEILVRREGRLSLHRYSSSDKSSRQVVAMQLTKEVLVRLVSDFSDLASRAAQARRP